jgi:hypothetical protein
LQPDCWLNSNGGLGAVSVPGVSLADEFGSEALSEV